MPRRSEPFEILSLLAEGDLGTAEKAARLHELSSGAAGGTCFVERMLVQEIERLRAALGQSEGKFEEAKKMSFIYNPRPDAELAVIRLAGERTRPVTPRDLVSGAVLAQIARDACEKACRREVETGEAGVRLDDLLSACEKRFQDAAGLLDRVNARQHLSGLPPENEVISVEPRVRRVARAHRFLTLDGVRA